MIQLPALNTPQFGWVKSRLPRKPQPVPPIYQPEVAADAILWATDHYRREWHIGASTAVTIAGNKIAPGFGDWYLSKQGYDAQQYDGAAEPNRPNNLFEPLPGDAGAHGDFDDRAKRSSLQVWLARHRGWMLAGTALAAIGAAFVRAAQKRTSPRPTVKPCLGSVLRART
jgi:hypothetical protein